MKKLITLIGFVTYIFSANVAFAITLGLVAQTSGVNAYPDGVYYDGVINYTQTSDAADTTDDDVYLPDDTSSDMLYIGSNTVFDTIDFDVTTAGNSNKLCVTTPCHHYTLQYYNGETSTWTNLSYTDNTNNFETAAEGTWDFDVPDAWDNDGTKTTVNGQTLFWVRLSVASGATVTTPADAGQVALRAYNVEITVDQELGTGIEALLESDFTVSGGTSNDVAGFREMGTGVYQLALDAGLTDSNYNILIGKKGYVDDSITSGVISTTQKALSIELLFSHKITTISNATGSVLTPDTVVVGAVTCTISGTSAYCALSSGQDGSSGSIADVTVTKSGYDSTTKDLQDERTSDSDAQVTTIVGLTETAVTTDPTGYFTLTVEETDGTNLTSIAEGDFSVSAGTDNTIYDFTNNGDGTYYFELATENVDNTYTITASVSGYDAEGISTGALTTSVNSTGTLVLDETTDPTGYFTFRVEETDGTDLTSISESDFSVSGGTSNTVYDFTNNGDGTYTYELATENADNTYSISASVSGYNTESISTGAMTTDDTNTGTLELDSSSGPATEADLTINVTNEDGDAMTSLGEGDFDVNSGTSNAIHAFTNSGAGNYVLSLSIDNADNSYDITVSSDGYVSADTSTGELTGDGEKSVSLDFGYKLTVLDENGDNVSSATVKAGDYETSCEYLGSGQYGCAIPLAESNYEYKVTLSGYETEYGEFSSDRDSDDDAQVSESVSLTVGESDCEANFDDIYGHWAEDYITELYCRGVVNGLDSDTFGPSNNATRAEFLKMALLNAGYDVDGASGEDFSDVSSGDWYYEYVAFGVDEDFIEGYSDDTFRPNDQINRAEALVITMRIAGVDEYDVDSDWDEFDDVDSNDWYAYAVETAADQGIVEGYDDGDFKPGNNITRAEVAAISVRTYDEYYAD